MQKFALIKAILKNTYQQRCGCLTSITIDTNHSAGITVKLMNKLRLVLKDLVVLPNKIRANLEPPIPEIFRRSRQRKYSNISKLNSLLFQSTKFGYMNFVLPFYLFNDSRFISTGQVLPHHLVSV